MCHCVHIGGPTPYRMSDPALLKLDVHQGCHCRGLEMPVLWLSCWPPGSLNTSRCRHLRLDYMECWSMRGETLPNTRQSWLCQWDDPIWVNRAPLMTRLYYQARGVIRGTWCVRKVVQPPHDFLGWQRILIYTCLIQSHKRRRFLRRIFYE